MNVGFQANPNIPEPPWEPWHASPGDVVDEPYPVGLGTASAESPRLDDEQGGWDAINVALVICGGVAALSLVCSVIALVVVMEALT